MSRHDRALPHLFIAARCLLAGGCIALAIPPAGWWPLAFVGIALWDRLLADVNWAVRLRRSWLVAAAWLAPLFVWMWDLTVPGYGIAVAVHAAFFALLLAAVPPGAGRWLALPGAIVLAELVRWSFPLDGVPLATLAMSQADSPFAQPARLGGALVVSGIVAVGGVAASAAWQRRWGVAAAGGGIVLGLSALAVVAPQGEVIDELEVAIVQGGGEQRTRARDTDDRKVFERHLDASEEIQTPVDLVLWPENVVSVEGELADNVEHEELGELARELDAPVIVGTTEGISDSEFLNASIMYLPDGTQGDRYDKVLRVPFGEYVPLRSLVERFAGDAGLPRRDARAGSGPATLDTPVGTMGVAISWEIFFSGRVRDAVLDGGEIVLNPTNGSSYWLTQVQTQQVASSRLRAIESGRWVLQAAPTGFSAAVTPDGEVLERTGVSERRVLQHTVERRTGDTIATRLGTAPVAFLAALALALGWALDRSARSPGTHRATGTKAPI